MKPSKDTVRRSLRQLRRECIESDDVALSRVAYAMECAVMWAMEDTVGWGSLAKQARENADLLRVEIERGAR